jgi:hypothetical protein
MTGESQAAFHGTAMPWIDTHELEVLLLHSQQLTFVVWLLGFELHAEAVDVICSIILRGRSTESSIQVTIQRKFTDFSSSFSKLGSHVVHESFNEITLQSSIRQTSFVIEDKPVGGDT